MRRFLFVVPIFVAGCANPAKEAEERYEMVKRSGTNGEICDASREVVEAYLDAGDDKNYQWWHTLSGIDCQTAQLAGANAYPTSRSSPGDILTEAEAMSRDLQNAAIEAASSGKQP